MKSLHHLQNSYMSTVLPVGQEWFTVQEVVYYSGWGLSYIKREIQHGILPAQAKSSKSNEARRQKKGSIHFKPQYRIHRRDLIAWLVYQGNYDPARSFYLMAEIIQTWPPFMKALFMDALNGKDISDHLDRCHTSLPHRMPKRSLAISKPSSTDTITLFNQESGKLSEQLSKLLGRNKPTTPPAGGGSINTSRPTSPLSTQTA